jgi:hypothetical protein
MKMKDYAVTVLLSRDPIQTIFPGRMKSAQDFREAIAAGLYGNGEDGFTVEVKADSHLAAAEVAFAICNSYPEEAFCSGEYLYAVRLYRKEGNRSLSVGDLCIIRDLSGPSRADGRYGCGSVGWVLIEEGNGNGN